MRNFDREYNKIIEELFDSDVEIKNLNQDDDITLYRIPVSDQISYNVEFKDIPWHSAEVYYEDDYLLNSEILYNPAYKELKKVYVAAPFAKYINIPPPGSETQKHIEKLVYSHGIPKVEISFTPHQISKSKKDKFLKYKFLNKESIIKDEFSGLVIIVLNHMARSDQNYEEIHNTFPETTQYLFPSTKAKSGTERTQIANNIWKYWLSKSTSDPEVYEWVDNLEKTSVWDYIVNTLSAQLKGGEMEGGYSQYKNLLSPAETYTLFAGIAKTLKEYSKNRPNTFFHFSAAGDEPTRTRTYLSLLKHTKKILPEYDSLFFRELEGEEFDVEEFADTLESWASYLFQLYPRSV